MFPPTLSLTVLGVYTSAIISGDIGAALINKFMFTIMIFSCVSLISVLILNKYDHRQRFSGFLFLPALMFWYVIMDQFFLPLLALLTFDEKGWSSR